MTKDNKKVAKTTVKDTNKGIKKTNNIKSVIIGIMELFVIVSIAFMSFVVITGIQDMIAKLITLPAILWAVYKMIIKFTK